MDNEKYNSAYKLYQSGLSLAKVGLAIGVSRQCVYKAFKARSFEMRTANEREFQMYDNIKFTLRNNGYFASMVGSREYIHRYKWIKEVGQIPEGWDIHHKDEDKSNNETSNFECLPKSDHTKKHGFINNQHTKNK